MTWLFAPHRRTIRVPRCGVCGLFRAQTRREQSTYNLQRGQCQAIQIPQARWISYLVIVTLSNMPSQELVKHQIISILQSRVVSFTMLKMPWSKIFAIANHADGHIDVHRRDRRLCDPVASPMCVRRSGQTPVGRDAVDPRVSRSWWQRCDTTACSHYERDMHLGMNSRTRRSFPGWSVHY